MLNLVPLQFLALLGYTILRLTVALLLFWSARHSWHYRQSIIDTITPPVVTPRFALFTLIGSEVTIATLFLFGAYTQIAALALFFMSGKLLLWRRRFAHPALITPQTLILLVGVGACLFITGAGFIAFDLPI